MVKKDDLPTDLHSITDYLNMKTKEMKNEASTKTQRLRSAGCGK